MQPYIPPYNIGWKRSISSILGIPASSFICVRYDFWKKERKRKTPIFSLHSHAFHPKEVLPAKDHAFLGGNHDPANGVAIHEPIYPNCDVLVLPDRSI